MEYTIFIICSFFAAFVATIAGFGSSTLLIPAALYFMDFQTAVFIVACFHLFNNLFKVKLFANGIDFKIAREFGLMSIIFAFIGARCINYFPTENLKVSIAIFIIAFSFYSLFNPSFTIKANFNNSLLGGILSGFLAGLIGLGGAIRTAFLIHYGMKKEVYIATAALIALLVDFTRIPTYILQGSVQSPQHYVLLPILIISAFLGVKLGKKYIDKIDQGLFKKLVFSGLILLGLSIIFT